MKSLIFGLILTTIAFGARASDADLVARVHSVNGVPQLMVNGVATEPRMFYGGLGRKLVKITLGSQDFSFRFRLLDGDPDARLCFNFDPNPGSVVIDRLVVRDITNDKVILSNAPAIAQENGTESKGIVDDDWPDRPNCERKVSLSFERGHSYQLDFRAQTDAPRRFWLGIYRSAKTPFHFLGAPGEPFYEQIGLAAQAGVNFVEFPITLPWPKPTETSDTAEIDAWCDYILQANSNALLIPRINVNPPQWWLNANPAEEMQWRGAEKPRERQATVGSQLYQAEAEKLLVALVSHLEERFGRHVAGYHIAGQNSNEWFYPGTWGSSFHGFAPADLLAWRRWLQMHYGTDAALAAKWNMPRLSLTETQIPEPGERLAGGNRLFYDPSKDAMLLDWNRFQQDAMADVVCRFAHAVRTATKGRKLVLFFYGYTFEFAGLNNGPANSGHYALRKVLDSPDIDIVCGPVSYFQRGLGGIGAAMSPAESVALAGKMWLMEDDTSTHLSGQRAPGWTTRAKNLQESNQLLLRNGAETTLRNMGIWWMDLCQIGWFDDRGLWAALDQFRPIEKEMISAAVPFQPEIAAVIDENSMQLLAPRNGSVENPMPNSRLALGYAGSPYGQYLLDDVLAGRVKKARAFFFLNAWRLTPKERQQLSMQTKGKVSVWCYASGYFCGDKASLESMEELTQFRVREIPPQAAWATPTAAGKDLGLKAAFGIEKQTRLPLFSPSDASDSEILATFPDGFPAVTLRRSKDGTSIFVGVPGLSSELVRLAAREAGIPLVSETDAVIFANGPFVAVHAAHEGPLQLHLARSVDVRDALTGEKVGKGPVISLPIKFGETRILRQDK